VLKRDVRTEKVEISDWRLQADRNTGMNEYTIENLVRMFEYYERWGLVGNPNVLRWLLKREPTLFERFIQKAVNEQDDIH